MSKIFRRSECEHALNLARKARRRGDGVSAERWLRHAERHIAIEDRMEASIEKSRRRGAELAAADARASEERNLEESERMWRELEDEMDESERIANEEHDETPQDHEADLAAPGAGVGQNTQPSR